MTSILLPSLPTIGTLLFLFFKRRRCSKTFLKDWSALDCAIFSVFTPELLILPAVDQYIDGGVEDEEEVREEGEDLAPHRPVVQSSRAVDQEQTDLQHNIMMTHYDTL